MEPPRLKPAKLKRGVLKAPQLFALAAALFALAGLVNLFVRQWAFAAMYLSLGSLYGSLGWQAAWKQEKP